MLIDNKTLNNNSNSSDDDYYELIPNVVQFWIYLLFLIPSILCSLFVLYYLLFYRTLRRALHNHAIIVFLLIGLIYEITIYPWMLYYYHYEDRWERSNFFCTLWIFIDWGLYYTQTILFAWATMERHILIFHHQWLSTQKKRFFVHYLPLIILILYCLIYYIVIMFFPSCQHEYDSLDIICVSLCSFHSSTLYIYDLFVHQISPNLIIIIFNCALLIRVHRQKLRVGRSLQWRKHWKMTVQLLFVSIIYLLFALPVTLLNFLELCGLKNDAIINIKDCLLFFNYCMILLCPFACALSLPQLRNKFKNICLSQHRLRRVAHMT